MCGRCGGAAYHPGRCNHAPHRHAPPRRRRGSCRVKLIVNRRKEAHRVLLGRTLTRGGEQSSATVFLSRFTRFGGRFLSIFAIVSRMLFWHSFAVPITQTRPALSWSISGFP